MGLKVKSTRGYCRSRMSKVLGDAAPIDHSDKILKSKF